jgi:hypothetical protein
VLWVTWRQHRAELAGAVFLLAAIAVALVVSGMSMRDAYHGDGVAACLSHPGQGGCGQLIDHFWQVHVGWSNALVALNLLPALAGMFIGAPLLGRELERGTWKLAFTQSVTRTRWLTTKLGVVALGVLALAAALTALLTWWRGPLDRIDGRIGPAFHLEGLSLAATTLFAVAVGTLAGALLRRTVAAMAVTGLVYAAVRVPVQLFLRPRYQVPVLITPNRGDPSASTGQATVNWVLGEGWIDPTGHRISNNQLDSIVDRLHQGQGVRNDWVGQYITEHHLRPYIEYQPNGRFWTFELIEAGLFVGLAAILVTVAIWLVRRRTT